MNSLLPHIKKHYALIVLLALFGFLFLYNLNYSTLTSWDEAWYASISREMVRSGNYLIMDWNGSPYFDHPPMGFWTMALSYKLLGINEFSTRLPSVLFGLGSIALMYCIAVELFKKRVVGLTSALILGTSVWYTLRVRSGNLDSIFVFFFLLTVFFSIKASKNFKYFPVVAFAFAGLLLSKTLVGLAAIVLIAFLLFKQFLSIKNIPYVIFGTIVFIAVAGPWYYVQNQTFPNFYEHHFLNIGTRNKETASYFEFTFAKEVFFFIHMGVRKWYYLWIASAAYLLLRGKFFKKEVFLLLLWNFVILFPFLSSDKTELWHLIPVYLPMALITAYGTYDLGELIRALFNKFVAKKFKQLKFFTDERLLLTGYLTAFLIITFLQVKTFWPEVIPQNKYTPHDVAISKEAAKYNKNILLDDDFTPIAVYYSDKNITPLFSLPDDKKTLQGLFASDEQDFVAITRSWVTDHLDRDGVDYVVLEGNQDFSIVTRP